MRIAHESLYPRLDQIAELIEDVEGASDEESDEEPDEDEDEQEEKYEQMVENLVIEDSQDDAISLSAMMDDWERPLIENGYGTIM